MSFQKILELQDYIQNKLADLETAKDGSLEQFIKNVESLIEKGFTFSKDDSKSLNQRSSHILQEELSPERQKFKMIKETIDKSRRAKSTMRAGFDSDSLFLPSLIVGDKDDIINMNYQPKTTSNKKSNIF